ncbi:MAG: NAD(P)-binding domain-containing protein [Magnetococcales bacterium]|nr:NAD(P)-binding domain-containing protein [Magnetococcales bacterium]
MASDGEAGWRTEEDLAYLKRWAVQVEGHVRELHTLAHQSGRLAIFTISSTVKVPANRWPYLTPIRTIVHGHIGGVVVFSQSQALLACSLVDGLVDMVLVDAEKKIGIQYGRPAELLQHFGITPPPSTQITKSYVEMGNLSAACARFLRHSKFQEFKANDITVDAVWLQLTSWFKVLSGRKFAIIGAGNIGFKLALKLVESGSSVEIVRRDLARGMLMADVLNLVKPGSTLATVHYNQDPLQACLYADAIIGCTNGQAVIHWEMVQGLKEGGLLIDVGKGCFMAETVQRAIESGIPIYRCDITSSIDGLVAAMERNRAYLSVEMGRQAWTDGVCLISGGHMGLAGDLIVDNYRQPTRFFGVSDGSGDMKRQWTEEDQRHVAWLQAQIASSRQSGERSAPEG